MNPTPQDPEFVDFPSEEEWLDLPCPETSEDFVERVLGAVQHDRAEASGEPALPGHVLEAYRAPEPSVGFVERTLQKIEQERPQRWRLLLEEQPVPEPSADFVDRVLRALRSERDAAQPEEQTLAPVRPLRRLVWAAAAAVIVVAASLFVLRDNTPTRAPLSTLSARAFSPDPWANALSSLSRRGLDVAVQDARLQLGRLAGVELGR